MLAFTVASACTAPPIVLQDRMAANREVVTVKEVTLITEDGIRINVSHFVCEQPNVCILAHGFMGSKRRPYITRLTKRLVKNFDVITFDFRGHGASGGVSNGLAESNDMRTVLDYAKSCGYKKYALVGFSLGGIQAIYTAAKSHDVDALVTVGTPADVESLIPNAGWLYWMVSNPLGRLLLWTWVRVGNGYELPKPVSVIEQVSPIPILIIHGSKDSLVDVKNAEVLYQKAKEPKELIIIQGMDHPPRLPEEFYNTVENWLVRLLK